MHFLELATLQNYLVSLLQMDVLLKERMYSCFIQNELGAKDGKQEATNNFYLVKYKISVNVG